MKSKYSLIVALAGCLMAAPVLATDREIDVAVSPAVLILKNKAPAEITVHANVPLADIVPGTATLVVVGSGGSLTLLSPTKVFEDECGDLVAKFDSEQVKAAVMTSRSPKSQPVMLLFAAEKVAGGVFSGTDKIRVK